MPSYQIPQFLDSGDAIFLWMNMRQFAFALFGFLLCFLLYTLLSGPSLDLFGVSWYAVIPVIPIGLVAAYISSGSYNGRPSEVYLYKIIIYLLKPRIYIFQRVPDLTDLNQKQALWLESSIEARLNKNLELDKNQEEDEFTEFSGSSRTQKAKNVQSLGRILDLSGSEAIADIYKKSQFSQNVQKMIKGEQVQAQEEKVENSENFFDQKTN